MDFWASDLTPSRKAPASQNSPLSAKKPKPPRIIYHGQDSNKRKQRQQEMSNDDDREWMHDYGDYGRARSGPQNDRFKAALREEFRKWYQDYPDEAKFAGENPCDWYDISDNEWLYDEDCNTIDGSGEEEDDEHEKDEDADKDDSYSDSDSKDESDSKKEEEEDKHPLASVEAIKAMTAQIRLVNKELKAQRKTEALAAADNARRLEVEHEYRMAEEPEYRRRFGRHEVARHDRVIHSSS